MKISKCAALIFAAFLICSVSGVPIPQEDDTQEGGEATVETPAPEAASEAPAIVPDAGNSEIVTADPSITAENPAVSATGLEPAGGGLPGAEEEEGPDFSDEIEMSVASLAKKKASAAAAAAAASSGGGGVINTSSIGGGSSSSGGGSSSSGGGGSSSSSGGSSGGGSSSGSGGGSSGSGGSGGSDGSGVASSAAGAAGGEGSSEAAEGDEEPFYAPILALAMAHLPIVIVCGILVIVLLCICGFSTKILSSLQQGQSSQLSHITDQFKKLKEETLGQTSTEQQDVDGNGDETVTRTYTEGNQLSPDDGVEVRRPSMVDRVKSMMPWSSNSTEGHEKRFSLSELKDKIKKKTSFSNPLTTCTQGQTETVEDESAGKSKGIPKYLRNPNEIRAALKAAVPVAAASSVAAVPVIMVQDELVTNNAVQELRSAPHTNATQQLKELEELYRKQSDDVAGLLKSPENMASLQNLVKNPEQLRNLENLIEKPEELKKLEAIVQNPAEIKSIGSVVKKPQELRTLEDLVQKPNELKKVESLMDRPEDMARLERSLDAPENVGGLDGVIARAKHIVSDLENLQGTSDNPNLLDQPRALVKDLEAAKEKSIYGDRLVIPPKPDSVDIQNSEAVNKLDRILQKFDDMDKLDAFSDGRANYDDGVEGLSDVRRPKGLDDYDRYSEDTSDADVDPAKITAAAKKLSKLPAGTALGGNVQNSPPGGKVVRPAVGTAPLAKLSSPARKLSGSGNGSSPVTATGVASKLARPGGPPTAGIRGRPSAAPQQRAAAARLERQAAVQEEDGYGQYNSSQRQPRHVQFNPDVHESYEG